VAATAIIARTTVFVALLASITAHWRRLSGQPLPADEPRRLLSVRAGTCLLLAAGWVAASRTIRRAARQVAGGR